MVWVAEGHGSDPVLLWPKKKKNKKKTKKKNPIKYPLKKQEQKFFLF